MPVGHSIMIEVEIPEIRIKNYDSLQNPLFVKRSKVTYKRLIKENTKRDRE